MVQHSTYGVHYQQKLVTPHALTVSDRKPEQ